MQRTRTVMGAVVVAVVATGCSTLTQKDCTVLGGVIGGSLLGAGGAAAVHNLDATPSDWERGAGAAGGAVVGAVIGGLIGHRVCAPEPEPVPVAEPVPPPPGTEIVEIRGTHFAFDSATLTSEGEMVLGEAVSVMNRHPDITVSCEGHTDSVGSEEYNMGLGQRRADSVCDYLVSQGISSSRVSTRSFGESVPAASNDTADGRAQNRRVEIIVQ